MARGAVAGRGVIVVRWVELGHRASWEVVAVGGPVVVLFGEDGAEEADDRVVVGEDLHDVGASFDLLVQSLERVVRPELRQ